MSSTLAILGAGGHGKVVADAAQASGEWGQILFFDDNFPERKRNGEWEIVGTIDDFLKSHALYDTAVVAIGDNQTRVDKANQLAALGVNVCSVIHPAAVLSPLASIGPGSVVCAGAIVNADAVLGKVCIVNTGAVVEHDCSLSDGVHISPNATLAGGTNVGQYSWIGAGAVTRQMVKIGVNAIVGAGAVVLDDVPDDAVVVGNPAKLLKSH